MRMHLPQIRHLSIRLTLSFSVTVIVAFAVFVAMIGRLFTDKLTAEMNLVVGQKMGLAGTMLDNSLGDIKSLYFSLIDSPTLQAQMSLLQADDGDLSLPNLMSMKAESERLSQKQSANIRSILLISKERKILDPIYAVAPYNWIVEDNPEFQRFLDSQLTGRFSAPSTFPMRPKSGDERERSTITYFGKYYDRQSYVDLGYVAINLTKYSIFNDIEKLFGETFSGAYVVDENGSPILETMPLSAEARAIVAKPPEQGTVLRMDDSAYAVYSRRLDNYPNWRIVGFVDYQQIMLPLQRLYFTILTVAVLVLAAIIIASFSIAQGITTPIQAVNNAMAKAGRGEWPEPVHSGTTDEIGELIGGFNAMVSSLERLSGEIAAEQEEKKKIEVAMVQSQLDLLQSQINPHFIHNTLNTMKYMSIQAGAEELTGVIVSFNALLRMSMSQETMAITVAEEVETLRHYMNIQQRRYDVPLEFCCDISPAALYAAMPKLILQPLVENALFHGVVPNGGGQISVAARIAQGRLWLTVWDDGTGIPPETLRQILDGILPNARGYNQIGLSNVSERLVLYYGNSSRLVVQSEEGQGTTISFSIPADTGGEEDLPPEDPHSKESSDCRSSFR